MVWAGFERINLKRAYSASHRILYFIYPVFWSCTLPSGFIGFIYPCLSGLRHWHVDNLINVPVPGKNCCETGLLILNYMSLSPAKNSKALAHYNDVIMGAMASQITSLTIVYSTVYLGADQRKHQSSASMAFVRGIHR